MGFEEEEFSESEESLRCLSDIPIEHEIEGLTPGMTTIESNLEDADHGEDMQMLTEMDKTLKENRKWEDKRRSQPPHSRKEDSNQVMDGEPKESKQAKGQKNVLTIKVNYDHVYLCLIACHSRMD